MPLRAPLTGVRGEMKEKKERNNMLLKRENRYGGVDWAGNTAVGMPRDEDFEDKDVLHEFEFSVKMSASFTEKQLQHYMKEEAEVGFPGSTHLALEKFIERKIGEALDSLDSKDSTGESPIIGSFNLFIHNFDSKSLTWCTAKNPLDWVVASSVDEAREKLWELSENSDSTYYEMDSIEPILVGDEEKLKAIQAVDALWEDGGE